LAQWQAQGDGPEEIAGRIYEDLYRNRASKAETAQVLAEILRRRSPGEEEMRGMLPDYIVEAIDYVTCGSTPGGGEDASAA